MACWKANRLINESRNKYHCQRIENATGNSRRIWSEVKNSLHSSPPSDAKSNEECQAFNVTVVSFFTNKVRDIRNHIAVVLGAVVSDPLMSDPPHVGPTLTWQWSHLTKLRPYCRQCLASHHHSTSFLRQCLRQPTIHLHKSTPNSQTYCLHTTIPGQIQDRSSHSTAKKG